MNEQRLVTLILIALLVLGAAGIAAVYFTIGDRMNILPGPASPDLTGTDPTDKIIKDPLSSSDTVSHGAVSTPEDQTEKEVATQPKSKDISPIQFPSKLTGSELKEKTPAKEAPPAKLSGSGDPVVLKDQSGKELETDPTKFPDRTIPETLMSNGSFNTAQEVTEGIIIGKRGATGDLSDFYKVRATEKTMILRLEPVLKKENQLFAMTVFNSNKKPIGQNSRKIGPAITLVVTPESTYYIKLDVRHAPVEKKPQYKLYLKFK